MHWLALLLFPLAMLGADIRTGTRLEWKANPESDLAGYFLYWGPQPGVYTNRVAIPIPRTNATLPAYPARTYFALTATNIHAMESGKSLEVSTTNHLRITLAISQAGTLDGTRVEMTNQVFVASSTSNVFFFGSLTIERVAP